MMDTKKYDYIIYRNATVCTDCEKPYNIELTYDIGGETIWYKDIYDDAIEYCNYISMSMESYAGMLMYIRYTLTKNTVKAGVEESLLSAYNSLSDVEKERFNEKYGKSVSTPTLSTLCSKIS